MKIRIANKKDLKECAFISKISELQLNPKKYPDLKYLSQFLGPLFLIALDEDRIIGYIVGEEGKANVASINLLVVDKEYRGRGLGKSLLQELIKAFKKIKIKDIYLVAPKWNKRTIQFYEKEGFTKMKYYAYFTKEIK